MTKEYIINFLKGSYEPYVDDYGILIIRKNNESNIRFYKSQLLIEMKLIIGEFEVGPSTSINIVSDWVKEKHEELLKNLHEIISKVDATKGSVYFLRILSKKKLKSNISKTFIKEEGIKYFKYKICDPIIDDLIGKYNIKTIKKCSDLISKCLELNEDYEIDIYIKNRINTWYCNNILACRIKELFSQFVINMGPRTWIVTWVGHGKVSNDKIISNFLDEEEAQHKFILAKYEEWYDEEIIDASSRYLDKDNLI